MNSQEFGGPVPIAHAGTLPAMVVGCYPGSFNPPTVAHLAVAAEAVAAAGLDRLDLVLSRRALGKDHDVAPSVEQRAEVLRAVAASRPWLGVVVTEHRLIADIARSYDAVVMGADKWRQVNDPTWYPDEAAWQAAVASLPLVLVAPRAGDRPEGVRLLAVHEDHGAVSASAVRAGDAGAADWMLPEARAIARRTGWWPTP